MDVWELTAREEIRELVARYAHFADSGRFEELVALFAEDGVLEIDGREPVRGRRALLEFLNGARESPRGRFIRHHVSSVRITVSAPGVAEGSSYFLVLTERGPDHWGRYRDRYALQGDRWVFTTRRVRVDRLASGS